MAKRTETRYWGYGISAYRKGSGGEYWKGGKKYLAIAYELPLGADTVADLKKKMNTYLKVHPTQQRNFEVVDGQHCEYFSTLDKARAFALAECMKKYKITQRNAIMDNNPYVVPSMLMVFNVPKSNSFGRQLGLVEYDGKAGTWNVRDERSPTHYSTSILNKNGTLRKK